jgi:protein SCO1/2
MTGEVRRPASSGRWLALFVVLSLAAGIACQRKEPAKQYPLTGQILAVDTTRNELTINHEDIPNLMPAMTMAYPVATPALMQGRTPGETIKGTLEVDANGGRLVSIEHTGTAPLAQNANQAGMASGVLDVGDPVPDAAFLDQTNKRRSLSEWTGTPYVITFIYTRCPLPNFCPLMDQNFATLQRRLADDTALHGRVRLISVTFDPEYDTPEVLAAHARRLKADPAVWTFLTGDKVTVERFAGQFGIGVLREPNEPVEITHNLRTAIVGADGRVAKTYTGNDWTPGALLADLRDTIK